jgi:hypothetical protein
MTEAVANTETPAIEYSEAEKAALKVFPPLETNRNGITMKLEPMEETRGLGKGKIYIGTRQSYSLSECAAIIGESFATDKLNSIIKSHLKECDEKELELDEAGNPTKTRSHATMKAAWETWTFQEQSIKILTARLLELTNQFVDLPDDNSESARQRATSLKSQIHATRKEIERKKRAKAVEAAEAE